MNDTIPAPTTNTPTPITSLQELDALCRERKKVEFEYNGRKCAMEVAPLTPAQEAKIATIIDMVTPPLIKGRTQEEDRLDVTNSDYMKLKSEALQKARAQALYWGVPAFAEGKKGLTDPNEICAYINELLTESILDVLWQAIRKTSNVNVAELVNFT